MTNRCEYLENCIMGKLSETCYHKTHYQCGIYLRKEEYKLIDRRDEDNKIIMDGRNK